MAVRPARRDDDARPRSRSDREANGRRRRARGSFLDRRRPVDLRAHAARRRHLARRADSVAAERRRDDTARDAADDDGAARVGVGHRLGVLVQSRGAAADRILRPHGIHGHVDLGGSADWRLDRVPVEPRASRRPRRRDGAPRARREHRGVRGSRRPSAAVDRNGRRRRYVAGICRVAGSRAGAERHRRAARRSVRAAERAARRAAHEPERACERRDVHDRSAARREGT